MSEPVDLQVIRLGWHAHYVDPPGPGQEGIIPGWYVIAYDGSQDPSDPTQDPRIILYVAAVEGGDAHVQEFAVDLSRMLNEHAAEAVREPAYVPPADQDGGTPSQPAEGDPDGR